VLAVQPVGLRQAETAQVELVVRRVQPTLLIRLLLMVTRMDSSSSPGSSQPLVETGVMNAALPALNRPSGLTWLGAMTDAEMR